MEQIKWSDKFQMGDLTIKNRIIMAALTRERCDPKTCIPNKLVSQYYDQRTGAGFIITEATAWSMKGNGFTGAACLYNIEQMEGWKKIVDMVHVKGGKIFVQLFHCGRVSHPEKIQGNQPIAPSPIAVEDPTKYISSGDFPIPKEMTIEDIESTKQEFQKSVKYAFQAGFDGIELHAAFGYLIHTFISSQTNKRKDKYGGSSENNIRFCVELIQIAMKYYTSNRIGIKISPFEMFNSETVEVYSLLLQELDKMKIGFVQIKQANKPSQTLQVSDFPQFCKIFRQIFKGVLIANDYYNEKTGLDKIRSGQCDAISFGKLYISNPDLSERIINNWQLNYKWLPQYFSGSDFGSKGYTDYPFSKQ